MSENNEVAISETGVVEITVKSPKTDRSVTYEKNFGKDLEESVALFGADVVHSIFVAQAVIRSQAAARNVLDDGEKGGTEAITAGQSYTPGAVRKSGGSGKSDPIAKLAAKIQAGELTKEQLLEMLAKRLSS